MLTGAPQAPTPKRVAQVGAASLVGGVATQTPHDAALPVGDVAGAMAAVLREWDTPSAELVARITARAVSSVLADPATRAMMRELEQHAPQLSARRAPVSRIA